MQQVKNYNRELILTQSDVHELPFPESTFGAYLSYGVVEHFPQGPQAAITEAYRVLKPGGLIFMMVPAANPVTHFVYDENKKPIVFKRWKELKPSTKILRINHYFTKSKEEYQNKIKRGWFYLDKKEIYFKQVIFDEIDKNNIEDKEIFKILDQ